MYDVCATEVLVHIFPCLHTSPPPFTGVMDTVDLLNGIQRADQVVYGCIVTNKMETVSANVTLRIASAFASFPLPYPSFSTSLVFPPPPPPPPPPLFSLLPPLPYNTILSIGASGDQSDAFWRGSIPAIFRITHVLGSLTSAQFLSTLAQLFADGASLFPGLWTAKCYNVSK